MVISEKQEALVKDSWEVMKQNIPQLSLRFFTLILEIAPEAKDMFSFLKDSDDDALHQNNPKLKSHAVIVFKLTCESAVQLREKGVVVVGGTTLKHLGAVHLEKGLTAPHFEAVKEALLRTAEEAMGENWSEEMREAWGESYHHLAAAIKHEMQAQAADSFSSPTSS
ncbi:unnamed protein product [Cuscuta epithymum]|uniref:Globin domain-containing protein n=1 Tax=Cuscuta epithymum TaxID=186058 RepID=A0AAV0FQH5_9ASTE|nr:unnamed protein product [Cuscuta epithymum]